jgi:hypothetical protein
MSSLGKETFIIQLPHYGEHHPVYGPVKVSQSAKIDLKTIAWDFLLIKCSTDFDACILPFYK